MRRSPDIAWITVNRACNLRCRWCYASETGYRPVDDMPFGLFCELVDLVSDLGIRRVILIGGEPTIYPKIFEAICYCKEHGLDVVIPSNGIAFSNEDIIERFIDAGLDRVGLSMKGHDELSYKDATGVECYGEVIAAIRNLSQQEKIKFSVSTVISPSNMQHVVDLFDAAGRAGATNYGLSFCYDFGCLDGGRLPYCQSDIMENVIKPIRSFMNHYEDLNSVTSGKFSLNQTLPLCLWEPDFINKLHERRQISSVCQLLRHSGLIFDTQGYVIPCNAMHDIKLGCIHDDFSDRESFLRFWNSAEVESVFSLLCSVPDERCNSCNSLDKCGGGCVSNWFNYSFEDISEYTDAGWEEVSLS